MKLAIVVVVVARPAAGAMGCTTTQKAISGGAVGGVAGLVVAGPIGAAAGATAGAVTAPMVGSE